MWSNDEDVCFAFNAFSEVKCILGLGLAGFAVPANSVIVTLMQLVAFYLLFFHNAVAKFI